MRWLLATLFTFWSLPLFAEAVVATKTIRAQSVITANDVTTNPNFRNDAQLTANDVVGMEARVVLYAGRPIRREDISVPAIVRRNQLVPITFDQSGLTITTVGRALDRGAVGELIQVMNVSSRTPLFGIVQSDGSVSVSK